MKETHHIRLPGVDVNGDGDMETVGEQDGDFIVEDYEAGDESYDMETSMDIEIGDEYVIEVNYDGGRMNRPKRRRNASGEERKKRRRKCGQCGPCQVKVDCGHCKYCERKDVLKQSCIYKKCVYLRKGETCLTSPKRQASGREKGSPARKEFVTMVNRSVRYTDIFLAEEENDHQDNLAPESADFLPVADASDNNESFELSDVGDSDMFADQQETMQKEVTIDPLPTIQEEGEIQEGPRGIDRVTESAQDNVSTFQSPRSDLAAQISKDLRECAKKSFSPDAIAQRRMTLERALNVPQSDSNLGYSVFNISSIRNNGRQVTPNRELSSSNTHDVPSSSCDVESECRPVHHPPSSILTGPGYAISHPISHPPDPLLPPACPAISSLSPVDDVQMPMLSLFNEAAGVTIKQEPPFMQHSSEMSTSSATEIASDVRDEANVNGVEKESDVNSGIKISSAFSLQRSPLPTLHADQYPIFLKSQSPPSSCQNQTGSTVHHTSSVPHKSLHATDHQSTEMNPQEFKRYYTKRMLRDPNHNLCNPHELNAAMSTNIFTDPFDNSYNGVDAYGDPRSNGQEKRIESDAQNPIDKELSSRENIGHTSAQNKTNHNLHNTKEASVHVCNPFQESYLQDHMNNYPSPSDHYSRSRLFPRDDFVQKRNLKRQNTDNPRRKYKKRVCTNKSLNDTLNPPSQKEPLESQPSGLSNKMDAANLSHNEFRGPYSMMNRSMYPPLQASSGNGLPYDPPWNPAMCQPFPGADFFKYHPNHPPPHPGLLPPPRASVPNMLPPSLIPPASRGMVSSSQMPPSSSQMSCHRPLSPRMMPPHPFMQPPPHMAPPAHVAFNRYLPPYLPMGYPYPPRHFPPGLAPMMPSIAINAPPTNGGYPLSLTGPLFVQNPLKEVPYPEIKKQLNDRDAMRDNYVKGASDPLPDGKNSEKVQDALIAKELPDRPSHIHIMSPEHYMTSPEMACDVITIDDFMVNAYIRGDGANSIEIQMDSVSLLDESLNVISKKREVSPQSGPEKVQLKGTLMLKQDLGEEGVIQMEIPGHAVTVEVSELDYRLTELSSNRTELLAFIEKGVQNNCT